MLIFAAKASTLHVRDEHCTGFGLDRISPIAISST